MPRDLGPRAGAGSFVPPRALAVLTAADSCLQAKVKTLGEKYLNI